MTALLIIFVAIVLLVIGYVFYGSWLAKQWGIDPKRKTPALEMEDGVDYVAVRDLFEGIGYGVTWCGASATVSTSRMME